MSISTPNYRNLRDGESAIYKYELRESFGIHLSTYFPAVDHPWVGISSTSYMRLSSHYQWDGASGPVIATTDWMTASLVHDGLYQLMKEKYLDIKWRKAADLEMLRILKAAGMPWWRRRYSYLAVRIAGGGIIRRAWREADA